MILKQTTKTNGKTSCTVVNIESPLLIVTHGLFVAYLTRQVQYILLHLKYSNNILGTAILSTMVFHYNLFTLWNGYLNILFLNIE